MRRREVIFAILGFVFLVAGAAYQRLTSRFESIESRVIESGGCQTPATIITPSFSQGDAVLLHGLSANRRTMRTLAESMATSGFRVLALDLAGHGDSTDAFSFERAEQCARSALRALHATGEIDPRFTVLIGHSMGGAIAIRMADEFDTAATVAISPSPLVRFDSLFRRVLPYDMPAKRPRNLLVLSADYDPPDLKTATRQLTRSFGKDNFDVDAFDDGAALAWTEIRAATHVSLLVDAEAASTINFWMDSLGIVRLKDPGVEHPIATSAEFRDLKPAALWPRYLALLGILLLFPVTASLICGSFAYARSFEVSEGSKRIGIGPMRIAAAWTAAAVAAVLILWLWVPLRFVRIYTGDYLASFFLVSGIALIAWRAFEKKANAQEGFLTSLGMTSVKPMAAGAIVGIVTFLAVGWWLNTQWYDAWMNAARWWRFAVLAPLLLPYFWAEELALEKLGADAHARRYASARRWGMFLLLRTIAWAAMAGALWLLNSQQILIVLMTMFFLLFSVLQRAGANAVGRRAGRAAAASFSAILAAWFIAAVFPLT